MISALTTSRDYDYIIKLIVLGDAEVGKTSLLTCLAEGASERRQRTQGKDDQSNSKSGDQNTSQSQGLGRTTAQFGQGSSKFAFDSSALTNTNSNKGEDQALDERAVQ